MLHKYYNNVNYKIVTKLLQAKEYHICKCIAMVVVGNKQQSLIEAHSG